MCWSSVVFLVILTCLQCVLSQVNDYCIIKSTGERGVCISIDECSGAKLDLSESKIIPQNCSGFVGLFPIICCKMSDVNSTKSTTSKPQQSFISNQILSTPLPRKTTTTYNQPTKKKIPTNNFINYLTTILPGDNDNNNSNNNNNKFPSTTSPYEFEAQEQEFSKTTTTNTKAPNFLALNNNGENKFNNSQFLQPFQLTGDTDGPVLQPIISGTDSGNNFEIEGEQFDLQQSPLARISLQKCKEYSQKVFTKIPHPILLIDRVTEVVDECFSKYDEAIPNGKAFKKEFPHLALIGYTRYKHTNIWKCSGSLISEKYVITSATCLQDKQHGEAKYVRLGAISNTDTEPTQDYLIIEKTPHPSFTLEPRNYNDIALLLLDRSVTFTPFVRPICLPTEEIGLGKRLIVSGWTSAINSIEDKGVDFAIRANLDLIPKAICEDVVKNNALVKKLGRTQVCGIRRPYPYNCQITSGSALLANATQEYCMFSLAGVLSFGHMCSNAPVIFTKLTIELISWIENIVWT